MLLVVLRLLPFPAAAVLSQRLDWRLHEDGRLDFGTAESIPDSALDEATREELQALGYL